MLQATNCVLAHAVPPAAGKVRASQRPGWAGNHIGFYPFPMSIADENAYFLESEVPKPFLCLTSTSWSIGQVQHGAGDSVL
jgi:hypothetical protein